MKKSNMIKKVGSKVCYSLIEKAITESLKTGLNIVLGKCVCKTNIFILPKKMNLVQWVYDYHGDQFKDCMHYRKRNKKPLSIKPGYYTIRHGDNIIILISVENNPVVSGERIMTNNYYTLYVLGKDNTKLIDEILYYNRESNENTIFISTFSDGKSSALNQIYAKPLEKIYLDNIDYIIGILDNHIKMKKYYNDHYVTYKHNMLLYGPPGTGKTSLSKAIASYMNYNITYVNPTEINPESIAALSSLEDTIILIEDIDRYLGEEYKSKIDIGLIMNLLDGVYSSDDSMIIVTANDISKLSEAFLRPGRFNNKIKIDNISNYSVAENMCKYFEVDPRKVLHDEKFPINQSYLQNKILKLKTKLEENK